MDRRLSEQGDDGVSPVIATLLLIALTLILCAVLAALCMSLISPILEQPVNKSPPEILAIVSVNHYNNTKLTFASKVTLKNIGTKPLWNSDYAAEVYINGIKQYIIIKTLQAHDFISTHHNGIQLLHGAGPEGEIWEVGNSGVFDLNDRTLHPGDLLQIDIIDNNTSSLFYSNIISRSIFLVE